MKKLKLLEIMLKVIIDTNVLVSSLIQRTYPFLIVEFLIKSLTSSICISVNVLNEYNDVLSREKFYPKVTLDIFGR